VILGAKGFLEVRSAILPNRNQTARQTWPARPSHSIEALTDRLCYGCRLALASEPCKFLYQSVDFGVLDIYRHLVP
jgi:hypothetical protein